MAPTLMGRHKEVSCPQCGFVYAVNASEEVEPEIGVAQRVLRHLRATAAIRRGTGSGAELQGRPDPGDDVSVRPAVSARKLRRRSGGTSSCFAIRKSRKSATSSGWSGCPARRSGSTMATSISNVREATNSHWLVSRCVISRRCRSTFTTTAISPRPWPARPSGSAGAATPAAGRSSSPSIEPLQGRDGPEGRVGRAAVRASRARCRAMGSHPERPGPAAGPSQHPCHRLLFVQHEHVGGSLQHAR